METTYDIMQDKLRFLRDFDKKRTDLQENMQISQVKSWKRIMTNVFIF